MRFLDTWSMHNTSNKKSQILFKVGLQNDEPNKKKSGIHTLIKTQSWLTV